MILPVLVRIASLGTWSTVVAISTITFSIANIPISCPIEREWRVFALSAVVNAIFRVIFARHLNEIRVLRVFNFLLCKKLIRETSSPGRAAESGPARERRLWEASKTNRKKGASELFSWCMCKYFFLLPGTRFLLRKCPAGTRHIRLPEFLWETFNWLKNGQQFIL